MPPGDVIGVVEAIGAGVVAGFASLPHCAAMCGPLCANLSRRDRVHVPLRYQLGRTVGYAFAGLVAGHFGLFSRDLVSVWATPRLFALLAGAACLLFAVRLLAPPRRASGFVPAAQLVRRSRASGVLTAVVGILPKDPFALGTLSSLLPCGSLYGALLLAAATASGLGGALVMAAFSLVTAPAVLASPVLADWLLRLRSPLVRRGVALTLVITGVALLLPGAQDVPVHAPGRGEVQCH